MVITRAKFLVNEPRLLRQSWLNSSIQIEDIVLELDVQSLLGGAGNVGLKDQAIGAFVDVDGRCISLSSRLSILLRRRVGEQNRDGPSRRSREPDAHQYSLLQRSSLQHSRIH